MRTVHETEALRPSDPVPKSHPLHPHNAPRKARAGGGARTDRSAPAFYGAEDGYDSDEEKLPPKELLRLLKQKQTWAEREQQDLTDALAKLEGKRKEAWVKKEMLLNRVLDMELGEEEARKVSLDWV